ncbi:MAG: DNA translocase FtsK, partial [Clostridia bacterium]|nr:DNA translocase FtsK [Clostridia bacterium]
IALTLFTSVICALIDDQTTISSFDVSKLFRNGNDGIGGGILGGGICVLLCSLIGKIGLWIFSVAGLLVLAILLTGVSLGKLCRSLGITVSKKSKEVSQMAKEHHERRKLEREIERTQREAEKEAEDNLVPLPQNIFVADEDLVRNKKDEEESIQGGAFVLTEDKFPQLTEFSDDEEITLRPDAPFHTKDVKTGVLTPLPDENGNFKEDDGEFEPPTLESMQERLDSATQEAIDKGVPLDRAVEAGQRLQKGEIIEAAKQIDNMALKSMEETRIINYKMPPLSLLNPSSPKSQNRSAVKNELEEKANRLLETLASFHVDAKILNITQGPSVTRFELQPGLGVKVSKITNLANDIALSLAATGVRIEAPIPGKSAVGIEIPNENPAAVHIREVLDTDNFKNFKSKTAFALGKDISGATVVADISQFPHILIAGATGSGKSVCINSLITSILYKARPDEVKLIMIDPKMVELGSYNGIPHLLIPVVTNPKHAAGALNWAVAEMKRRYTEFKNTSVRNISGYNKLMEDSNTPERKLPEIVIIIDELADLMVAARSEVETSINSLAALARAAGMYLVIATQRPSVDVITGVIKANIPSRIAFAVSSQTDSRTIIDTAGADKLLGKGDMLYFPRGASKPTRIQGNFLSDKEIENVINFIKNQYEATYDESIIEQIEREPESSSSQNDSMPASDERDDLFIKAVEMVIDSGQAS